VLKITTGIPKQLHWQDKKNSFFSLFLLLFLITIVFSDCKPYYNTVSNNNVSFLYNPSLGSLKPEYRVYHTGNETSALFFAISTDQLIFSKTLTDPEIKAKIKINYQLIRSLESNEITDSATTIIRLEKSENKLYTDFIEIKIPENEKFTLKIVFTDVTSSKSATSYIDINKANLHAAQNYLPVMLNGTNFYRNFVYSSDSLIFKNKRNNADYYFVSYYDTEFEMAQPPFSLTVYKSTALIPAEIKKVKSTDTLVFAKRGMYIIQTDTSQNDGFTIHNFGDFYPEFKTAGEMLKPVRFLVTSKEFKKYEEYTNKKLAVDEFWLKSTGNTDRAREVIRAFYNRASFANVYFTSYLEGWKSDRGMIYMIYGAPKHIYKTNDSERWLYGDSPDVISLSFTFSKVDNNFSENDYILIRKEIYKSSWYQAVDTWRNGRVYSIVH